MNDIWTIVLIAAVAVAVFLLLRWMAARRAVAQAQRRREGRARPSG